MSSSSDHRSARDALLDAAAVLMDTDGVDHASLNEINRAAGQSNRSAIQYHFGSRDQLVLALAHRTIAILDAERTGLLDQLEAAGATIVPRDGLDAVVQPLVRQLSTVPGRRHLRLLGQLLNHPRYNVDAREAMTLNPSLPRAAVHVRPLLDGLQPELAVERGSQVIAFAVRALADQARLIDAEAPPRPVLDSAAFTANLIDMMVAMLAAESTEHERH